MDRMSKGVAFWAVEPFDAGGSRKGCDGSCRSSKMDSVRSRNAGDAESTAGKSSRKHTASRNGSRSCALVGASRPRGSGASSKRAAICGRSEGSVGNAAEGDSGGARKHTPVGSARVSHAKERSEMALWSWERRGSLVRARSASAAERKSASARCWIAEENWNRDAEGSSAAHEGRAWRSRK